MTTVNKKRHFEISILLAQLFFTVSCGNMQASIQEPSGFLENPSQENIPIRHESGYRYEEAIEATEVREMREQEKAQEPSVEQGSTDNSTKESAEKEGEKSPSQVLNPVPVPSPKPTVTEVGAPKASELNGPGVLKPTVYYFVVLNEDEKSCDKKTYLHGAGGKKLLSVCPKTAEACGLQGSCAVVQDGKRHTFNILGRVDGQDRFFEVDEKGCRFGYGVNSSCLDPFYTLAADLTIYKPGEVIYVPAVVGLELPDGSKHTGYFVIRDQGRGIKGRGRFDFYSGFYSWLDPKNPFNKLGLGDVNTNIPYFRVTGETAKKILQVRAYPQLPPRSPLRIK